MQSSATCRRWSSRPRESHGEQRIFCSKFKTYMCFSLDLTRGCSWHSMLDLGSLVNFHGQTNPMEHLSAEDEAWRRILQELAHSTLHSSHLRHGRIADCRSERCTGSAGFLGSKLGGLARLFAAHIRVKAPPSITIRYALALCGPSQMLHIPRLVPVGLDLLSASSVFHVHVSLERSVVSSIFQRCTNAEFQSLMQ